MRVAPTPLLLLPLLSSTVLAAPDILAAFEPAIDSQPVQNNDTLVEDGTLELLKRQTDPNECADGYYACVQLNAPGLCCRRSQICSADANRNVACCPQGAACTGTIGGPGTRVTASPTITGASSTVPFTVASSTDGTFVQQTGEASRSMVPNQYYPFAFIPTTYTNAAACSSAYTTCQSDAASCTAALASGQQGVTVSAPNGGVTITAVPSLGLESASAICASLSSKACYELQVEACVSFGEGQGNAAAKTMCAERYLMGAGMAVGIAGGFWR